MVDLVLPNTEAVQVFYDYFIEGGVDSAGTRPSPLLPPPPLFFFCFPPFSSCICCFGASKRIAAHTSSQQSSTSWEKRRSKAASTANKLLPRQSCIFVVPTSCTRHLSIVCISSPLNPTWFLNYFAHVRSAFFSSFFFLSLLVPLCTS